MASVAGGLVVALVAVDGLDGQTIWVNPAEVVSVRTPSSDLLHSRIKCSIQTVDGKVVNVTTPCDEVRRRIGKEAQ